MTYSKPVFIICEGEKCGARFYARDTFSVNAAREKAKKAGWYYGQHEKSGAFCVRYKYDYCPDCAKELGLK